MTDRVPLRLPPQAADVGSLAARSVSSGPALPCLRSDQLFGGTREVLIEHSGTYYRLRITQSNKLILTK